MRRWVALPIVAVLASMVPPAAALYELDAELAPRDPLHLEGLMAPDAPGATARLLVRNATEPDIVGDAGLRLLDADGAYLEVRRWQQDPVGSMVAVDDEPTITYSQNLTNVTLRMAGLNDDPQLFVHGATTGPPTRLDATVRGCDVWNAEVQDSTSFPQGDRLLATGIPMAAWQRDLVAECSARNVTIDAPHEVYFYGPDLQLTSNEDNQLIRTGTFQEETIDGVPVTRTVMQILVVRFNGQALHADVPFEADLRMHAQAFLAAGRLEAGPAEGRLTWGHLERSGSLEPFAATGAYRIIWAADPGMTVLGSTLEGPPVDAQGDVGGGLAWSPGWATAAVMAGLGLLVLLARALWLLFSRLAPDRILDHPRRQRILAYARERPGATLMDLSRDLDMRWGKALYHVTQLSRAGHVRLHRVGGRTALFPTRMGYAGREAQLALLQRPSMRRVYDLLQQEPGLRQAELARRLGVHRAQISRTIAALTAAGLVVPDPATNRCTYRLAPAAPAHVASA